jgi:hypothetical protein
MLDQVRKGGLNLVLAHQHLAHLADNRRLLHSVLTNARIRAVFGGLSYDDASLLANEMFLADLNSRQIKQAYYHTIHLFDEQTRISRSQSTGHGMSESSNWSRGQGYGTGFGKGTSALVGSGNTASFGSSGPGAPGIASTTDQSETWINQSEGRSAFSAESSTVFSSESSSEFFSEGASVSKNSFQTQGQSEVPVWVPVATQELTTESEWTREEKISKISEMLKYQNERHCFIKLDTELTQPLEVPFVRDYSHSPQNLQEYENAVYETQGALKGADVDLLLAENETRFLGLAATTQASQSERPKSEPPLAGRRRGARKSVKSGKSLYATIK